MAIIVTPGASDADSYASLVEANAYHDARLYNAEWLAATDANKEIVLKWGTRLLDENYDWLGSRANNDQALGWPRYGTYWDGESIDGDIIPVQIINAVSEMALFLLKSDRSIVSEPDNQGLDSLTVGPISLSFSDTDRPEIIPDTVSNICSKLSENKPGMVVLKRA